MKKGFTLIELLAVIVILAIIALIATPIVLNIISDSKESSTIRSAENYISAVEQAIARKQMSDQQPLDGVYTINSEGNLEKESITIIVESNGTRPTSGVIVLQNGKIVKNLNDTKTSIVMSGKTIEYNSDNRLVIVEGSSTSTVTYKCKRATTLHTEECTQTDASGHCIGAGYTTGGSKGTTTITYGNLGTPGTLTSGDAFDCDVNGDGNYTERFYYVSDYYNTTTKTFDDTIAILIYYNNTTLGVADNTSASTIAYDTSDENWHGPVTAIANLPTTQQWSNINLSNSTRAIINETGGATTTGGTLPTSYSYSGYAARLLTAQEINVACNITVGSYNTGELDTCNYLMENTRYSSAPMGIYGYWLETPPSYDSITSFGVADYDRNVLPADVVYPSYGLRPAIEILKSDISY